MRPPSGDRLMLIAGPRRTSTSSARASSPSATPTSRIRSRSQLEPIAAPGGKQVARQAVVEPEVVGGAALPAYAVRAVGQDERADAVALAGGPEVAAGEQRRLRGELRVILGGRFRGGDDVERHLLACRHRCEAALQVGEHVARRAGSIPEIWRGVTASWPRSPADIWSAASGTYLVITPISTAIASASSMSSPSGVSTVTTARSIDIDLERLA